MDKAKGNEKPSGAAERKQKGSCDKNVAQLRSILFKNANIN